MDMAPGPRRVARWGLVLAGLVAAYALAGFLAVPLLAGRVLVAELSRATNRSVDLASVSFNPFTLTLELHGLRLSDREPGLSLVAVRTLRVNAESFPLLLRQASLSEVLVDQPQAHLIRRPDGSVNILDLLPHPRAQADPPPDPSVRAASRAWGFRVENLRVLNASLTFNDTVAGVTHRVGNVTLSAPVVASAVRQGEQGLSANFTAVVDEGWVHLEARGDPFAANGTLAVLAEVRNLPLGPSLAEAPLIFAGPRPSGRLDANATANMTLDHQGLIGLVSRLDLALTGLEARDAQGREVLRLPRLGLEGVRFFLPENRLEVEAVTLAHPLVRPELSAQGLNLATLVRPAPEKPQPRHRAEPGAVQGNASHAGAARPPVPAFRARVNATNSSQGKSAPANDTTVKAGIAAESGPSPGHKPGSNRTQNKTAPVVQANSTAVRAPAPFSAEIHQVRVTGGRVEFADSTVSPGFKTVLAPLDLTLSGIRSDGHGRIKTSLSAATDNGEKIGFSGEAASAPLSLAGTLEASGLDLKRYAPYLGGLPLEVFEGRAGAKLKVELALGSGAPGVLVKGSDLSLDGLRLRVQGDEADLLRLDRVDVRGLNLDLAARRVDVGQVAARGGGAFLARDANGMFNAARLAVPSGNRTRATGERATQNQSVSGQNQTAVVQNGPDSPGNQLAQAKVEPDAAQTVPVAAQPKAKGKTLVKGKAGKKSKARSQVGPRPALQSLPVGPVPGEAPPAPAGSPWTVVLRDLRLDGQSLRFLDRSNPRPVDLTLDALALHLTSAVLSGGVQAPMGLELAFGLGQGRAKISGQVGVSPPSADLTLDCTGLDLAPLAGYAPASLKVTLARGQASLRGRLVATAPPDRDLTLSWKGGLGLHHFQFVDTLARQPLLQWGALDIHEIQAGMNPDYLQMERVNLDKLYASVVLTANRTLNLVDAMAQDKGGDKNPRPTQAALTASPPGSVQTPPPASAQGSAKKAKVRNVVVETVVLTNSTVDFTDLGFKPPIEMRLDELHGRVQGLISKEGTPADISLEGRVDGEAPISILGQGTLFGGELFLDLKMTTDGLDLARMSSYSEKYLGHAVRSGKLALDLQYKVRNSTLDSQNKISLDNLALGRKVESPDAVDLPISLALALLRNSDGVVELDVPVRGDLNKPDFSIAKVIWEALAGMFKKLIFAPFSFLGLPFGQDKTGYIDFEPDSLILTPESARNLDKLVSAVVSKPDVDIEVAGQVDATADEEGVRRYMLFRDLAELKIKDLLDRGEAALRVDEVTLTPEEYQDYLGRFYRQTKGFFKPWSAAKTEKELLDAIVATEEGQRQFARKRALAVRDNLTAEGRIPLRRVYVVEPDQVAAEPWHGARASRVNVTLRY